MIQFVNLTPHEINIVDVARVPSHGVVRVREIVREDVSRQLSEHFRVPLVAKEFDVPEGVTIEWCGEKPVLDKSRPVFVIVSFPVAQDPHVVGEVIERVAVDLGFGVHDGPIFVVAPDTGPESAVRDEQGRIVGVRRLFVPRHEVREMMRAQRKQ